MKSFIGEYKNCLSKSDCNFIIKYFESCPEKFPGVVGTTRQIKKEIKDSLDIAVNTYDDSIKVNSLILPAIEEGLIQYKQEYNIIDTIDPWMIFEKYNIQRYLPNQGYFKEHCETSSFTNGIIMVWMIYLNTVTDGGGTRFKYQDVIVNAEEGKLLIWPAYYTHVHCGVVSPSQTKYIATGWFRYREDISSVIQSVLGS